MTQIVGEVHPIVVEVYTQVLVNEKSCRLGADMLQYRRQIWKRKAS